MKLDDFFRAIAPMLHGTKAAAETARELYGERAGEVDGRRLAKYAANCRATRFRAIDEIYPECLAAVTRGWGSPAWEALVDGYFRAHPMRRPTLPANGDALAEHARREAATLGLPPWIAEIADLEWREWETTIAPNVAEDDDVASGPLRLVSTATTRPYEHEVVEWLDGDGPDARPAAPARRASVVLFWRDRRWCAQRAAIGRVEVQALRAVRAANLAADGADVSEALDALREMGVVIGEVAR